MFNTKSKNNPPIKTNNISLNFAIIAIALLAVVGICFGMTRFNGNARNYSQEEIEILIAENEDNPQSVKYLVTDTCISRVKPNTNVQEFVANFDQGEEVKVYSDEECTRRVTDGFVMSGMYAKYTVNETTTRTYEISVLGDINEKTSKTEGGAVLLGDGILNQIELTRDIRCCVDGDNWNIDEEVEKKSADVNCNNQIDSEAVNSIVRYIVFGELNVDEIDIIDIPELDVQGRMDANSVYKSDVVVTIRETDDNAFRTVYKITGDKTENYKELVNGEEITLTEDGTYKITAYTYGQDGNKSKRGYEIITIDKKIQYSMEYYLEGTDGVYTKVDADTKVIENGSLGQNVDIEQKDYTDYVLDVDNVNGKLSGTLTENGLVLKAYYQRKAVTYSFEASNNINGIAVSNQVIELSNPDTQTQASKSVTLKWGEKIYVDAVVDEEAGYTIAWDKWVNSSDDTDVIANKNSEITIGKTSKTYQAKATKTINNYTITYDLDEGALPENVTNRASYTVNTENFDLINPSKRGFIFEGWTGGVVNENGEVDSTVPYGTTPNITTPSKNVEINSGSLGNRKYTAVWTEITGVPYKVEHYKETLETGIFELVETENKQGEFDETVTAQAKSYVGFTYDEGNANEVKSGTLTDNNDVVLKLYYTRNSYTLTIEKNENIDTASATLSNVKYGQNVNISATMKDTAGYTFTWTGWKSSNTTKLADIADMEKEITMPADDITLTATASKNAITYTIEYDAKGGSLAEGVENPTTYTVESNNITINNLVNSSRLGYEFKGWTGGVVNDEGVVDTSLPTGTTGNQDTASTSVSILTGSIGNRKYTANWEEADYSYVVKYNYEDEEAVISDPITAKFNSTISTFEPRAITGYKLREEPTPITISYDETQNVLNVYYIKETYTLTLQKDENFESVSGSGEYKYNQEVDINAVLKTENGYDITWTKWETQTPATMSDNTNRTTTIRIPAGNVTLKATANKTAKTYTITYNYNNGELPSGQSNPESYTIETDTFTLKNPTKQGYVFTGWTGGTTDENQGTSTYISEPTETAQVQKGSLGNRVYTANWEGDSQTAYTVKHYKEKVDGTYELAETQSDLTGTTDSTVTAQAKTYDGFEFDEERSAETKSGKVLPDGSLVLELYYKRCFYTVTLTAGDNIEKVGYSITDSSIIETGSPLEAEGTQVSAKFKYGAQVNIYAQKISQTGYTVTWDKWQSSNSAIIVNQTEPNPIIGIAIGDVTLTAKATKAINKYGYRIEFYYDGTNDSSKTEEGQANYGSTITNTFNKVITGYEEDTESNVNNPLTISEVTVNNVMKIYYKHIDYRITYELNGGNLPTGIENKTEYTVNTPTFTLEEPIKAGYTFEGWTGTNGSTPQRPITIEQGQTGNRTYNANWIANTDTHYTVEHYKENLDGTFTKVEADTETLTGTTDTTVTAVAKSYEGYTLDETNENAVPSGTVTSNEGLVLKLYYKRNMYTLKLVAGDNVANVTYSIGSENASVIGSGYELTVTGAEAEAKFKFGAQVNITATLNTEENYDIKDGKWTSNNDAVKPTTLTAVVTIPTSDATLTASATKSAKTYGYYTKYYYDNELDEEHDVVESNAAFNSVVENYTPKAKTGYEFKRVEGLPLTITSNKENNVISVYYEHIDYTIEYDLADGTLENNEEGHRTNPESYNVKTDTFTLNNPTRAGYTFLGWTGTNGEVPQGTITIEKGSTGNRSYTANWNANNNIQYKIEHYIENLDSTEEAGVAPDLSNYTLYRTEGQNGELTGTTDTTVTADALTIPGFDYNADKSAVTISGTVTADGELVLKVFYTRKSFNLTLVAGENVVSVTNGGTQSTESVEKSYKYGQTVAISAVMVSQDGYTTTWNQWASSNTELLNSISVAATNVTIPAGDVTLTGSVTLTKAKFAYSVEFYYDNVREIVENAAPVDFETQILTYSTEGKEKTGYVLDRIENLPLTITSTPSNNVIRYYYIMDNYDITYDLDGGDLGTDGTDPITNPTTYTVNTDTFTLNNPTKANCEFLGWTGTNGEEPQLVVTIEKGSTGDRTYTANWQTIGYRVIVHHYLEGTGTSVENPAVKVAEDEILTSPTIGANYTARNLIPTYNAQGEITNEDKDIRSYLDGREVYVVNTPANETGTYTESDIEVTYYYQYYPSVRIVSTADVASDLVGTEYVKIEDALQALEAKGLTKNSTETKIEILRNISDQTVLMSNKNIVLDLHGYTLNSNAPETIEVAGEDVKQATIKLDNSKLQVIDESSLREGKVTSKNGIGVYIKTNSEFTLGIEAKPVETTPEVIGKTFGIYKDIDGDEQGIFNLFDGKVIGKKAKNAVSASVDLMPVVYKADTPTVTIDGETYECLCLAIIDNVEARIGRVTYGTLEDAINAANVTVAEDGSQVEVVLVKDITKTSAVTVDNTKNIKLNLDGHTFSSTATDYAIINKGLLEIVDSSANSENKYGTGKITISTGATILNTYSGKTFQREYTFDDFVCPSDYKFVLNESTGKIESNNTGIHKTTAYGYIYVDLRDKTGEFVLDVNASISSETNSDYGYGYIKTSSDISASGTEFMRLSGEVTNQNYMALLNGGNEYYIHFQYSKDKNTNTGDDKFTINSINLRNKYYAELKVTNGVVENAHRDRNTIENYGTLKIGNKEVTEVLPKIYADRGASVLNYRNSTIESGSLTKCSNYGNILFKGGTLSNTLSLYATKDNSQVIEGGSFYYIELYQYSSPQTLTIKDGLFRSEISSGSNKGQNELYIQGGTFNSTISNFNTSKMQITGGTFNGEVNTSNSAVTIIDEGTFNNKLSFSSSNESTINKATIDVTADKDVINVSGGILNLYDVTATINRTSRSILNISSGVVNVYEGTYSNPSGKTVNNTGTINIYDGEFITSSSDTCILNNKNGTINIGNNDGTVSVDEPTITALSGKGIDNQTGGTLNFYDGIIKASVNNTIKGTLNSIADNVQLLISYEGDNDEIEVAKLGTRVGPVAQIGTQTYQTLESAIASVPNNCESATTIKLLQKIYQLDTVVIPQEKKIILDLNGYDINGLTNGAVIENNGDVQIQDGFSYNQTVNFEQRVDSESGFTLDENGSLVSTNHTHNSLSHTYFVLDLTEVVQSVSVETKVLISSESNCDYGYARITRSTEMPDFTDSGENIFKLAGYNNPEQTFTTNLKGGKVYYLHFAYKKDNSKSKGEDLLRINSITIKNITSNISSDTPSIIINDGKMNLKNIRIANGCEGISYDFIDSIINRGELEINGANIEATAKYKRVINNIENGKLVINSGKIQCLKGNGNIGINNSSSETVYINGGQIRAERAISNNNQGNIVISNGKFDNYSNDSGNARVIENNDGNITIENAKVTVMYSRQAIYSKKGSIHIENIELSGTGGGIANYVDSELIIDNGTIGCSINNEGTATIKNGTINASITTKKTLKIENGTFNSDYNINQYSTGTIEITGGNFTARKNNIPQTSADVTIRNVEMTSGEISIITYSNANIKILSGKFVSTSTGSSSSVIKVNSGATLTLGVKDDGKVGNNSSSNIYISGNSYGIDNSGTFNFYEGYIEGVKDKALKGSVTDKESGYEPIAENIENNTRQSLTLKMLPMAVVQSTGTTEYTSLQDAVDASTILEGDTPDTVTLTRDVILGNTDDTVEISSGKKIIIDVAGHKLTVSNEKLFSNLGNITFVDSSDGKTGLITCLEGNLIECSETGKVTFDGVNVNATDGYVAINNTANDVDVINNANITGKYGIKNTSSGNVNVNSSTINCTTTSIVNEGTGTVEITSGDITGTIRNTTTGEVIFNSGSLTGRYNDGINNNNGTVTIKEGVTIQALHCIVNKGTDGNIIIQGGTITSSGGGSGYTEYCIRMINGTATISNGTIKRIDIENNSTVNISGGEVTEYVNTLAGSTLNITGGTFKKIVNKGTLDFDSGEFIENHETIENSGTATIKNVELVANKNIIKNTGTLTLINVNGTTSNSNSSYCYGINNEGTVTLSNTTITETADNGIGIYNKGTVNLGLVDENPTNTILVSGGAIGISKETMTAKLNYQFGEIKGNIAVKSDIDLIPNNKMAQRSVNEGVETISLVNKDEIARIGETPYNDLQSAFNAVPDNGAEPTVIKVTSDFVVTLSDKSVISSAKNVVLDLDGHTIYAYGVMIENNGKLKLIDDSATKGAIVGYGDRLFSNTGTFETLINITQNKNTIMLQNDAGTVKLTDGNISVDGKDRYSNTSPLYGNIVVYSTGTGRVELTGANIEYSINLVNYSNGNSNWHGYGIYCADSNDEQKAEIIVSGGLIRCKSTGGDNSYGIYADNANITVTNGAIQAATAIRDNNGGNIVISGGEICSERTSSKSGQYAIYCDKSHLEISGGAQISSQVLECIYVYQGSIIMRSGEISSEGAVAIKSNYSTVNITGGSVVSNGKDAIYSTNNSIITIGNSEYPVSRTEPLISGATYGVNKSNSGTLNFYDGKIMGNTKAINGTVNNKPEEYSINYYENETIAILELIVTTNSEVEMGTTAYPTLQQAIDAADDETVTISLIRNIELTQPIQIASNQNITIDLNGKSIVLSDGTYAIENLGNLTIVDNLLTVLSSSEFSKIENSTGVGIFNQGTLTLGVEDSSYHPLVPTIVGGTYGIENNGTLRFFDGRIRGATAPLGGNNSAFSKPTGYNYSISATDNTMSLVPNE